MAQRIVMAAGSSTSTTARGRPSGGQTIRQAIAPVAGSWPDVITLFIFDHSEHEKDWSVIRGGDGELAKEKETPDWGSGGSTAMANATSLGKAEGQTDALFHCGKIRLAQTAGLVPNERGIQGREFGSHPGGAEQVRGLPVFELVVIWRRARDRRNHGRAKVAGGPLEPVDAHDHRWAGLGCGKIGKREGQ